MSWCGGGLIMVMPGWPRRRPAMKAVAFFPGSWPPSPGFEPCAILISSCSARARYSAVTPKRADATCLMAASRRSPSADGAYHAGSSPPSPELALPPSRAMPMLIAWCASGDSAPRLIAELTKRRAMRDAGSTSSSGTGRPAAFNDSRSRGCRGPRSASRSRYAASCPSVLTACCSAFTTFGA